MDSLVAGFPGKAEVAAVESTIAAPVSPPVTSSLPVARQTRVVRSWPVRPPRIPRRWVVALLAGVTVLLGIAVPLSPVLTSDPVVSWPRAGQPARSTVVPMSPYRPLRLDAVIPCATIAAVAGLPGGGTILRTVPAKASEPDSGLAVTAGDGRVRVLASRQTVLDEPLPTTACQFGINADASGLRVTRDGTVVAAAADLAVPAVSELATDADGTAATGLGVQLHADNRYASHPSTLKMVLLILHVLALAATVLVAWRRWPGAGPGLVRPKWGIVDAVLVVVAAAWVILGPLQYDDAWYALMARNASASGYVGNYVYMFNITESPFVASQYLAQAWGALGGWSLWWMRVLPLLYGVGTWLLLRTLLATALGRMARRPWVGWALLGAFLAWWLPYGMVLRPEPLIMLCSAGVLVLAELARRRRSVGALVAATALAALAVTASPSGLVAWAPLPLALPWLWQWCKANGWVSRVGALLALTAAITVVVPVAFAVSGLADVQEASRVHRWYYVTYPWYEEWVHYKTLLGNPGTGSWGRRGPVLLTLGALVVVAIASGRRFTRGGELRRLMLDSAVITAIALVLLGLSPTKAVLHFGGVIAPATVLLTAALLRTPLPRRSGAVITVASVAVAITAAVMTFAGPNLWHPYSDRGMPFGDHLDSDLTHVELDSYAPHLGHLYPRDVKLWLAVAIAVAAFAAWRRRRRRSAVLSPDRGVLIAACTALVLGMIAVFAYAPLRQYPGWTIASGGAEALGGNRCGLADDVTVLADANARLGPPSGSAQLTGDFAVARQQPVPAVDSGPVWHDAVPGGSGAGSVITPWYPLPVGGDATNVTVPVIGNNLVQQRLTVEFDTGNGVLRREPLRPDPQVNTRTWQELAVPLQDPAVAVRVVAESVGGAGNWMAVGQPRLTRPRPVTALTDGRPVFADQLTAVFWPCVNQTMVSGGIAQAPAVRLVASDGIQLGVLNNGNYRPEGGVWAHVDDNATYVRTASLLRSDGPLTPRWGGVERVLYDYPAGQVDVTDNTVYRHGWASLPTLATERYNGQKFQDRDDG